MSLAGFDVTPADELPPDEAASRAVEGPIPADRRPTDDQKQELTELVAQLQELRPDTDWRAKARELAGVPGDMLTATIAADLIDRLRVLVGVCGRQEGEEQ
jgi:hypothetical protein